MTAAPNLPHSVVVRQIPKHGALVLHGFGVKLRCDLGHVCAEWGVGLRRFSVRIPKIERHLRRVIVIGSDGYCTFEALRSLADLGISLTFIDRGGKLLFASGPTAPSDPRLRRAQSLAIGNGTALRISKELIKQKLDGQASLVRDMLHNDVAADSILGIRDELSTAETIERVRIGEAIAGKIYWQCWSDVPIRWSRKDERRVPEHWTRFTSRISPITHSPRLACNPVNSILNLLYGLTESACRSALIAMGLDPDIGWLHVDTPNRSSAANDCQEILRVKVDAFVLDWLKNEFLRKADFWQDRAGSVRICTPLAVKLCETSEVWCRLAAPIAELIAAELWNSIPRSPSTRALATRLTQSTKRTVKGSAVPVVQLPIPAHVCRDCAATLSRSDKILCSSCTKGATRRNFRKGRKMAQSINSLAKRSATQEQHRKEIHKWKPTDLPSWLTREVYISKVVPALASVPKVTIRESLQVSEPYSIFIQRGTRIPHQRHWSALASLAAITGEKKV